MATNILRLTGLAKLEWVVDTSQGTNPANLSYPGTAAKILTITDGNRNTGESCGCSLGSNSGYAYITLRATLPRPMTINRIYVSGNGAAEEGGSGDQSANPQRNLYVKANGSQIYTVGTAQNSPSVWDDSTVRNGITVVDFLITASYGRPSGGGFCYGQFYEFELYGEPTSQGMIL